MAPTQKLWTLVVLVLTIYIFTVLDAAPPGSTSESLQTKESHCMPYSGANSSTGPSSPCHNGCIRGWLGRNCDIERIHPEMSYYCVNMGTNRDATGENPYVLIRLLTNGIEKIELTQAGMYGSSSCVPQLGFNATGAQPGPKEITMRVDVTQSGRMVRPSKPITHICTDRGMSDRMNPEWSLQVRESLAMKLEYDLDATLKCNFSDADDRHAVRNISFDPVPTGVPGSHQAPARLEDDVILELVNYTSNQPITKGYIGAPVKLRITFGHVTGSVIRSVSPYSCSAKPSKYGGRTSLIDSLGCSKGVVPEFKVTGPKTLETGWFPMFSLPNYNDIRIQCAFNVCFGEQTCTPVCYSEPRLRRRHRRRLALTPILRESVSGQADVDVQVSAP